MSIRHSSFILLAAWLLGAVAQPGAAQQFVPPVYNPANGHWYQVVPVSGGITWPTARAEAAALSYAGYPGHLVTITSAAENQFLVYHLPLGLDNHWRVGGYQDQTAPDYSEPAGGWRWITGEPWSFTNWHAGEPNNFNGENLLEIHSDGTWNDTADQPAGGGYIVEYEPLPGPAAAGVTGLILFPNPVIGGLLALGEVTLPQPAGPGGTVVTLTNSNPGAALVPGVVTLLPGATTITFPITTLPVSVVTPVIISAGCSGGTATAVLQILPLSAGPVAVASRFNLLANGSFEEPRVPVGQAYATFGPGGLPGWNVLKGTVDIDQDWQPAPAQGTQSLGLVGTPGAGSIEQSFATVPGQQYVFSGWISHDYGGAVTEGRADVYLNGAFFVQLYHHAPTTRTDMAWQLFSYPFTATSSTTTLTLTDVTSLTNYQGLVLDGLSVTPADG